LTQTATASGTSGGPIPVFVNNTNSVTRFLNYTGDTATSIYVFGAQLETGAIPTSYIPTTTASATRAADVCSVSGVSGYIGQTEGTLYAEVDARNFVSEAKILAISDGTVNNAIRLTFESTNLIRARIRVGGATQAQITTSALTSGIYKIALAYKQDDFAMYVNGSQIGTDTSGTVPACSQIFLGKQEQNANAEFLNDRLRAAAIYTTRLDNTTLANLTRLT
jgi:hypothetical protein